MSVKIRKLTRNNVWVDTDAIQAKESFGDDYAMYVSYCDSRRIVERNGKHYKELAELENDIRIKQRLIDKANLLLEI